MVKNKAGMVGVSSFKKFEKRFKVSLFPGSFCQMTFVKIGL